MEASLEILHSFRYESHQIRYRWSGHRPMTTPKLGVLMAVDRGLETKMMMSLIELSSSGKFIRTSGADHQCHWGVFSMRNITHTRGIETKHCVQIFNCLAPDDRREIDDWCRSIYARHFSSSPFFPEILTDRQVEPTSEEAELCQPTKRLNDVDQAEQCRQSWTMSTKPKNANQDNRARPNKPSKSNDANHADQTNQAVEINRRVRSLPLKN